MYRTLLMFPSSVSSYDLQRWLDEELVPAFGLTDGYLGVTPSVGALMGPSAKSGRYGAVITVEFNGLDAALEAIQSDAFAKGMAESAAMGVEVYLFETADRPAVDGV